MRISENLVLLLNDTVVKLFFSKKTSVDKYTCVYVVVNFSCQVIFVFLLFWGMVMYANEVETKEK